MVSSGIVQKVRIQERLQLYPRCRNVKDLATSSGYLHYISLLSPCNIPRLQQTYKFTHCIQQIKTSDCNILALIVSLLFFHVHFLTSYSENLTSKSLCKNVLSLCKPWECLIKNSFCVDPFYCKLWLLRVKAEIWVSYR